MFVDDFIKLFYIIKKLNTPLSLKNFFFTVINLVMTLALSFKLWRFYIYFFLFKVAINLTRYYFFNKNYENFTYDITLKIESNNFLTYVNALVDLQCINLINKTRQLKKNEVLPTIRRVAPYYIFILTVGYSLKFLTLYFKFLNKWGEKTSLINLKKNFYLTIKNKIRGINNKMIEVFKEEYPPQLFENHLQHYVKPYLSSPINPLFEKISILKKSFTISKIKIINFLILDFFLFILFIYLLLFVISLILSILTIFCLKILFFFLIMF